MAKDIKVDKGRRKLETSRSERSPLSGPMRAFRNLQRAHAAISGNSRNRLQFEKNPERFMLRFGSVVVGPTVMDTIVEQGASDRSAPPGMPEPQDIETGSVGVKASSLHGNGLFAEKDIPAGGVLCATVNRSGDNPTATAQMINWTEAPNVEMFVEVNGKLSVVANQDIPAGSEILGNYPDPNVGNHSVSEGGGEGGGEESSPEPSES